MNWIEFIILKFIKDPTCFERHTAQHQDLQTVFAASGLYNYVVTDRCPGCVETKFRAAYRSPWGAPNCICSLLFIHPCGDRPLSRLDGNLIPIQPGQRPITTWVYKLEAANTVGSSWWWAVWRSEHVKPLINFGIINSITSLHLVGCFYWRIRHCLISVYPWHIVTCMSLNELYYL
jgi:hypothetical protein